MDSLKPILAAHPFFRGLDDNDLELIVGCASNVRYDSNEYLFRIGQEADKFFLIREGRVSLEIYAPGRGPVPVDTYNEGEVLSWSWLLPPYRWQYDARASVPVRAIALDGKCLRTKCEDDHDLGYTILKRFAHIIEERLRATRLQLLDVYGARD
jgi:CRP-like cAMP-binding protein